MNHARPAVPCEIHDSEEQGSFHRGSSPWKYRDRPEDGTGAVK